MVIDEWEQRANANAAIAIRLDSGGHKAEAIEHYRRAIDAYDKLLHSYHDYKLNNRYSDRIDAYQRRIHCLVKV